MKKNLKYISKNLPPVLINIQDVRQIFTILSGEGFKNITLKTEDYDYDAKELIKDNKINLDSMKSIRASKDSSLLLDDINIDFADDVTISRYNDDSNTIGTISLLENFLAKKIDKVSALKWYFFNHLYLLFIFSLIFYVASLLRLTYAKHMFEPSLLIIAISSVVGILGLNNFDRRKRKSFIVSKKVNFWVKYGNKILLSIIVALITYFLPKIFDSVTKLIFK